MAGKGDTQRPVGNRRAWDDNYLRIFRKKDDGNGTVTQGTIDPDSAADDGDRSQGKGGA